MPGPRVLIASYSGVLGGAERVLLDCATRLARPVTVACPEGPLAEALRAAHVAHVPLRPRPLKLDAGHVAHVLGLTRELRRLDPGFIAAWGARAVLATALAGRPWLAVHHDLLDGPVLAATRTATKRAHGVAAASQAIANQFGPNAVVLHPGVDLNQYTPSPLPPGPPHALVLGALVAWKRPQLALEIAALMPELRLTLAGATLPGDDGALEASLRAQAGDRATIGPVTDVPAALAGAHVLLHCADAEPYGMALVEALAAGRPVVAAAAGGPLEIVTGHAGRLYPPGDAGAAAEALRSVLADPGASTAARRRAELAFDVRDSARRFEQALDAAIAARDGATVSSFAAVIVLHESREELAALLDSLQEPRPRLIVVDSGRDDGGAELAQRHGAQVLERRDNPGFGAASNAGLKHVTEDVTILLNPDIVVRDGSLAELARRASDQPSALHAPRLLNEDGSVQRSAHPLPGTLGAFLPALVHPPLLPRSIKERVEPFRAPSPRTVGWAVAACLAAATPTLKRLGPFDPRIHLFAEDMDLCLRARNAGLPTILHPDLQLTHTGGHSVLREGEPFELLARQRAAVIEATRGRWARNLDDAAQALTFAVRALVKRPNDRERAQLAALNRWGWATNRIRPS